MEEWRQAQQPGQDPSKSKGPVAHDDADDEGPFLDAIVSLLMQAIHHEPSTYKEAMSRPDANQWELAMIDELKSHEENGTWILVDRPQREIGFDQPSPTPVVADNHGAIFLAVNPAHDRRIKHVDIRYHFIREFVERKECNIVYVSTNDMIADVLTKPLGPKKFLNFRPQLGMVQPTI